MPPSRSRGPNRGFPPFFFSSFFCSFFPLSFLLLPFFSAFFSAFGASFTGTGAAFFSANFSPLPLVSLGSLRTTFEGCTSGTTTSFFGAGLSPKNPTPSSFAFGASFTGSGSTTLLAGLALVGDLRISRAATGFARGSTTFTGTASSTFGKTLPWPYLGVVCTGGGLGAGAGAVYTFLSLSSSFLAGAFVASGACGALGPSFFGTAFSVSSGASARMPFFSSANASVEAATFLRGAWDSASFGLTAVTAADLYWTPSSSNSPG
mmetsp:Transcript_9300/g.17454  ORF Transcript_9300/g.17454 Transcript_9300/m.17454 type:complete len:263 (-) Transcript_9300:364-1152(-)